MRSALRVLPFSLAVAFLIAPSWGVSRARAADEEVALRDQALFLNNVTGDKPIVGQILALVDDAAHSKKLIAVAAKMAKEKEQPFNYNACFILARACHGLKDPDNGRAFYRLCIDQAANLKSGYKTVQSYGGLIDMLYKLKKYDESEKVCQEYLEMSQDDTFRKDDIIQRGKNLIIRQQVQALARQGKTDEALKISEDVIKTDPTNWLNRELKGFVQREAGQYAEAAKTFEDILDRVKKDTDLADEERKELVNEYRYTLSGLYVDMKAIDKAANELKELLAQEPDNPTYNNDLGYIWVDHDMNIEESEKLIRKAIEVERKLIKLAKPDIKPEDIKDNAAYLDSLGWVLFKQKKFKEAKVEFLKAIKEEEGKHIEIYDHLADTHMALGEKAEAVDIWKKSLDLPTTGKREQERKAEVEKKLKANQ